MMPPAFRSQIRQALENPVLQAALDANAERRLRVRQEAFASLSDPQGMRQRAHASRAEVIARLDHYLEQFIRKVEDHGIFVHRAADAAQAVQIVHRIASQSQANMIAKSKTMVSEEIGLNQALEAAGIRAVETDLGEYIIQLRGEHPSHIITPAVHLRRQEVGQTFHDKLGIPLTEDIAAMTEAARQALRQVFLEAKVGLSGVNFGVAETGTLCILTNEGNGRMVTTLPPVHIALMGIERLVPTLEDLALMLALLPRSATGQKLTVYTSLIQHPRQEKDSDGPSARHLVLVDNGRSRLRSSPLAEVLFCIRCGACLNACPVFREIGGHAYVSIKGEGSAYPGPIGSVLSPALFGQSEFGHLARASSLCGACKEACPVDIDLPKLLLKVRAGGVEVGMQRPAKEAPRPLRVALRVYTWAAVNPRRFSLAQKAFVLLSRVAAPFSHWVRLPAFTGWGYGRDFPRPAMRSFRELRKQEEKRIQAFEGAREYGKGSSASGRQGQTLSALSPTDQGNQAGADRSGKLVEAFGRELGALGGVMSSCSKAELPGLIVDFLEARQVEEIQAWAEEKLPPGLLAAVREAGIRVSEAPLLSQDEQSRGISVGLTGASGGIAATGTLILPSGDGRPLTASLLPEVHLAVLRSVDIYAGLEEAFANPELRATILGSGATVLISGPSRTADIEMTLTIGVHGPKEVHVFCFD